MDGDTRQDFAGDYADLEALRGRVRATRRAASTPLLLVGAGLTLGIGQDFLADRVLAPAPSGGEYDPGFFGSTPMQLLGWIVVPLAFVVLWWVRRRARAGQGVGVSRPAAAAAAGTLTFALLPPLVAVLAIAGPFFAAALGLLIIGVSERVRALLVWSATIGVVGLAEGLYWITNRLPESAWAWWSHDAIMLTLAVLTVLAGVAVRVGENHGR